jgi:nitroreductase
VKTLEALLSRISVSSLRNPAPNGNDLDLILRSGLRAPDHGGLRPWRFVLIRGAAREVFADTIISTLKLHESGAPRPWIARKRSRLVNAPLIIALGVRLQLGQPVPEIEQMLSVGAATMNMLNAVHALGYGGIWITEAMTYDSRSLAVLGLGASDKLVGFLLIGTPTDEPRIPHRPDVANHVTEWTSSGATSRYEAHASASEEPSCSQWPTRRSI